MDSYKTAGIHAHVGYEIGTPSTPDKDHDGVNQLPLTNDALELIVNNTQGNFTGGFFWDMYKESFAMEPNATTVAQAICNSVMPGSERCNGTIPVVNATLDSFPI